MKCDNKQIRYCIDGIKLLLALCFANILDLIFIYIHANSFILMLYNISLYEIL